MHVAGLMLGRHVFGGARTAAVTDATRVVRHDGLVAGERTGEAAAQPSAAVIAAVGKAGQRRWAAAAAAQPAFRIVPAGASEDSLRRAAAEAGFPWAGQAGIAPRRPGCYVPTARTPR